MSINGDGAPRPEKITNPERKADRIGVFIVAVIVLMVAVFALV